jgi:hypothetical protein
MTMKKTFMHEAHRSTISITGGIFAIDINNFLKTGGALQKRMAKDLRVLHGSEGSLQRCCEVVTN